MTHLVVSPGSARGADRRFLCVLLSWAMAAAPVAAVQAQEPQPNIEIPAVEAPVELPAQSEPSLPRDASQLPRDTTLLAPPQAGKIDTTYITPNAIAVVVLRPAQILGSAVAQQFPVEVVSAAGLQHLGFDPADVEEVLVFAEPPWAGPPQYAAILRFNKPLPGVTLSPELRAHTQPAELGGRRYLQSQQFELPSFYAVDRQTLIVAPEPTLRRVVAGRGDREPGPMVELLREVPKGDDLFAAVDIASLRPLAKLVLAQADRQQIPPEAVPFLDVPDLINAAELTLNISRPGVTSLLIHGSDEAGAERLETMWLDLLTQWQEKIRTEIATTTGDDPVEQAMAKYMERMTGTWMGPLVPEREGSSLVFFRAVGGEDQQRVTNVAMVGIVIALTLPAVQAAREAARRAQSVKQMQTIVAAMHRHHDEHRRFPAHAIYSDDGEPLLSWRVHILPYLGEEEAALYKEFRLDEPWDSPHNRQLIGRMPAIYRNPNLDSDSETNYLAVVGEPYAFDGSPQGHSLARIIDGVSLTVFLVEADLDAAVPWTKPADLAFDPDEPTAGLGNFRPSGWLAGWGDGHVSSIANARDAEVIRAMMTRAGREDLTIER